MKKKIEVYTNGIRGSSVFFLNNKNVLFKKLPTDAAGMHNMKQM